ncbi:hypothetical protein HMPREF9136_2696 [Prevotella dentalis DSM 3688]|uniref:Uncharacterized protein n=1 Tax=Prevotella dentalis (strain ATCC 49559 / DSM 3688 / JCM 13448 / NCTC 12043 / ES 2772) TaxID=908937 RepID=F9D768_PREDD|nr:hypothetical protein HMPREF9136_2696 [Prevotella dentalis DSM 3688]
MLSSHQSFILYFTYIYVKCKNTLLFGNNHVYFKENLVFAYILTFLHKNTKNLVLPVYFNIFASF